MSTVVIAASGPSLMVDDLNLARSTGLDVIAVSDAWRLCSWAKWLYAGDAKWWDYYCGASKFQGRGVMSVRTMDAKQCETDLRCVKRWHLDFYILNEKKTGLSDDPAVLHWGHGSGYQAVGLAKHLGYSRVLLLGFDMAGGHYFGEHPEQLRRSTDWGVMRAKFETLADSGLEIINCSLDSALARFPKMSIGAAIVRDL